MLARTALLLTTLLTGAAGSLSATPFWERWSAHIPCNPFISLVCPDITLWTQSSSLGGSTVGITFRNPQNIATNATNPYHYRGPWWTWWSLNVGGGRSDDIDALGWYAEGSVYKYEDDPTAPFTGPNWVASTLDVTWTDGMYLAGCGSSTMSSWVGFYKICPQEGFGGSVTFYWHFRSLNIRLPEFTRVRFYGATYFDAGNPEEYGSWGPPAICNDVLACTVTVAPEPSTWALLGGGLALIAAANVARRRRRKASG
jgi:hypothetical protein